METKANLTVRVEPSEMVRYVLDLMMTAPSAAAPDVSLALAQRHWGGDTPQARAAQMRWNALNRAFGDARIGNWTLARQSNRIHVPAALIAAAGVAQLTMQEDEIVFDIPTLLDATLELCDPVGHA